MTLPTVLYGKDVSKILKIILTKIIQNLDLQELEDYVMNEPNLQLNDLEVLVRDILEKSLSITIQEVKKEYHFSNKAFRNFPSLDELIYHKDGWTLHNSIEYHYKAYNRHRIKINLINSLLNIIATEIQRLPNTVLDTLIQKFGLYKWVRIYGKGQCSDDALMNSENSICRNHFGDYEIGQDEYELPPYHFARFKIRKEDGRRVWAPACKCSYVYFDDPDDVDDIISDDDEGLYDDFEDIE